MFLQSCQNDTSGLSDATLNFVKGNQLMDEAVPAYGGQPIVTDSCGPYVLLFICVEKNYYCVDFDYRPDDFV